MISNQVLIDNQKPSSLKLCLTQMYDFVAVKYDAWQCFKNWYGCDIEIERKIVRLVDENNIVLETLDLYPAPPVTKGKEFFPT